MKKVNVFTSLLLAGAMILSGCGASNTTKGGIIGAGAGAAAGAAVGAGIGVLIGGRTGARIGADIGVRIGAEVGVRTGAIIGHKMDKQKTELERIQGAQVESVNEGQAIKVTFASRILFATGKSNLSSASQSALSQFAASLNGTPDTDVLIYGHTDSNGGDEVNMPLSQRRAQAVGNFLMSKDVAENRMTTRGMGSSQPVEKEDEKGVQPLNRRVEIYILPNAEMIRKAELESIQEKQEFVIEKTYNSTQFYKEAGCTPHDGVLVFYTAIPDLKFSLPDTPSRLLRVSNFDAKSNCYMLCVEPTEKDIDSQYTEYSITITAQGYKPEESFMVSNITPGITQHFMINPKLTSQQMEQIPQPSVNENSTTPSENMNPENEYQEAPDAPSYASLNWYIEAERNRIAENYPEAIYYYLKALEIDLMLSDAWNGLANVYYLQGNYTGAIEYYKKWTAKYSSETVWNKMGICYQQLQEYDNAIDCFQKSNSIANNGSAWYGMGKCYADKKKHSKSIECMKKAAQLGHEDAQKLLTGMNKRW